MNLNDLSNTSVDVYGQALKKKLFTDGGWAFSGQIVTSLMSFVINIFIARLVAPEEFGVYFLVFSVVSILSSLIRLGLDQTAVQLIAHSLGLARHDLVHSYVFTILGLFFISALVVSLVVLLGAGNWLASRVFKSLLMSSIIPFAVVWTIVFSLQKLLAEIFRGFGDIRMASILNGFSSNLLLLFMLLSCWSLNILLTIPQLLFVSIAAGAISIFIATPFLYIKIRNFGGKSIIFRNFEVLNATWPFWVTSLLFVIMVQVDIWMVGVLGSDMDMAIYGSAVKLITPVTMSLAITNGVVAPLIAEMYAKGQKVELERVLRATASMAGIPSLLVLGAYLAFGEAILGTLYGDFYRSGVSILRILSVGQAIGVWSGSCGILMTMTKHQRAAMIVPGVGMLLSFIVSLMAFNIFGISGIALGSALGVISANVLSIVYDRQIIGIKSYINLALYPKFIIRIYERACIFLLAIRMR